MSSYVKGKFDYLRLGDWNAVCYMCGFKFKASMLVRYWQGFYVCDQCYEIRQPQDFVRGVPDTQAPPWTQPEPEDVFIPICTPNTITAYPGFAQPGCAIPNYIHPAFDPNIVDIY
jgi:hypothetical protein